ncbi:peptidylprolyl isomerase [Rhodocytophaga rosea]|uniref:Peptidyl-prolyl cis-trans isomerase n=1 Tax=Rhodocytophaga rosea TaxID=2704465 RepID=A0A6C0GPB3_9BACT|nr:peptidylprolyl isomerase [Rhodocytophaga rosea]QHT69694.1 peptidylprolyl isomerase [Rhodocytophaga rosea]
MLTVYRFLFFLLTLSAFASYGQTTPDSVFITFQTNMGDIEAVLYTKKAPITSANFLKHIETGAFTGGSFYRTVTPTNQPHNKIRIEVIQGGANPANIDTATVIPIPLERTSKTGVLHKNGTLSMARDAPDTGSTEFFICIGDQPSLDFGGKRNPDGQGFAAFGRVTKGMEVVKKIQSSPASEQKLTPSIQIIRISRK